MPVCVLTHNKKKLRKIKHSNGYICNVLLQYIDIAIYRPKLYSIRRITFISQHNSLNVRDARIKSHYACCLCSQRCTSITKFIYIFYLHTFKNSDVGKCSSLPKTAARLIANTNV